MIVSTFFSEISLSSICGAESILSDETGVPHTVKF